MAKTRSFEQDLKALEDIVTKLEAGSVSLDEALNLFQKGRALSRSCEARLREVELKIQKLLEDEDGELHSVALDQPDEAGTGGEASDEEDDEEDT